MPRFLHTADWQIGRQYGQLPPDDAIPLAEARFKVVDRIAALTNEHQVDAVLVAGDVFDTQTVSPRTIRQMFNAMAGFRGQWISCWNRPRLRNIPRWESAEFQLSVRSDVDPVIQWLHQQEEQVALNLVLTSQTDIEHHFALTRAISEAETPHAGRG